MGESSSTIMSGTTSKEFSTYLNVQEKSGIFLNQVFSSVVQEANEMREEIESLGRQYSQKLENSNLSHSQNFSKTDTEDYTEVLDRKSVFIEKLTTTIELTNSINTPKYVPHSYHEFLSLLNARFNEATEEIKQNTERLKIQDNESSQLTSQANIFSNLLEEDNESFQTQEYNQLGLQFENTKKDIELVVNILFPDADVRRKFVVVMAQLVEAYVHNLDNKDNQYVEIPSELRKNSGLICLIAGKVVVSHPLNSKRFCLCV